MRYEKYGEELSALGYDVTPLNGKVPILKGWQKRPETAKDFAKHGDSNIGILAGGIHNIVAVDVNTVSPPHDVGGMTAFLAATVMLYGLALVADPTR